MEMVSNNGEFSQYCNSTHFRMYNQSGFRKHPYGLLTFNWEKLKGWCHPSSDGGTPAQYQLQNLAVQIHDRTGWKR